MSPHEGLIKFALAWAEIVSELLQNDPWPDWSRAPSGAHGAIDNLEIGALFVETACRATRNGGKISLKRLISDWVDGNLKIHGKDYKDLMNDEKNLIIRRTHIYIKRDMAHLIHFGLVQDNGNVYSLTDAGSKAYEKLLT